ncbi:MULTISPECIES: L-fucose/L-arabinose isomerase family protein [unclassified Paenibacillus]|uniref:L-fucose/L-arabinose isomerase family protein n=1 Tax=unclassified Paenibacillus TaxID=185978 RepID=UPI0009568779|nr:MULTISPECIES: L-fucose/L-arabinose isomerase family protein [unclassified Paenibacillus]ASS65456.1 arabinose isomerase [Paenibacillus sp. RUD330]SIQ35624.1 L-arabinose isomerase [Paenibacillus sp. RU4X]SIQ57547.1 L-arabinose isomerase [Paenibacillus sp. RU4T]
MTVAEPIKPARKARVGLYSVGLRAYWEQFPGLRERLESYGRFIENRLSEWAEVCHYGLVDTEAEGRLAGEWFNRQDVDLVFCHAATYTTSSAVLPVHQLNKAPAVFLNLQPAARLDYEETTTGEWLAQCGACPVPEFSNAFNRAGIPFRVVNGLLGLDFTPPEAMASETTHERIEAVRAWHEIREWALAAAVPRTLKRSRFGFLGNTYSGMLDMYSDFTMIQAQTGLHVEVLEMCDLDRLLRTVAPEEIRSKREEVAAMFQVTGSSSTDPIAGMPSEEQLDWSCRVAAAQEKLVREYDLDALAYYYHGAAGGEYEKLQGGFIVGHSLLTARGIPCAGEGDLKTALAMKICDILGTGGSFSEIIVTDYVDGTILLGHDGPFHIDIAEGKPLLRGMGLYHGKQGTGVSVEAKVAPGPVTTLNVTQTGDGRLKLISSEGESTKGPIMRIGNTQTPVRFREHPDAYMARWFAEAPTHHCAMSVGHNASLFAKAAELLNLKHIVM